MSYSKRVMIYETTLNECMVSYAKRSGVLEINSTSYFLFDFLLSPTLFCRIFCKIFLILSTAWME